MAAVQRTIPGGERMAALWLHDAQIQKHVSHTNRAGLLNVHFRQRAKCVVAVCVCMCVPVCVHVSGRVGG